MLLSLACIIDRYMLVSLNVFSVPQPDYNFLERGDDICSPNGGNFDASPIVGA